MIRLSKSNRVAIYEYIHKHYNWNNINGSNNVYVVVKEEKIKLKLVILLNITADLNPVIKILIGDRIIDGFYSHKSKKWITSIIK